jgi:hypothetical protein
MIKVTMSKITRARQTIREISEKISDPFYAPFVEEYSVHLKCLNQLLTEFQLVQNLSPSEDIESSVMVFNRLKELKTVFCSAR